MNYGELKTAFTTKLRRRDVTPTQVASYVQQGIARIQRTLRVPAMEKSVEVTIDETYGKQLPIPSDFLALIALSGSSGRMDLTSSTEVDSYGDSTGTPLKFYRRGSNWILGPAPEVGDVVTIDYYGELDALSSDSDTNFLTSIAPDIILYSALSLCADDFLDKRSDLWEAKYQTLKSELQDQANADELTTAYITPPINLYEE